MEKYKKSSRVQTRELDSELVITVKTLFGLEQVLADELRELGYERTEILNRAVQLRGTWKDVYRLNLHLRCALTVLVELAKFRIAKEEDLYKQASKINWPDYFDKSKSFAIKGAVNSTIFRHTQYPFLLLKDAIADVFRDQTGDRPDVNVKTPQVVFDLYIYQDQVTISLNTSGLPLYQRGYRESTGEAPLNEVLAAGMLRLSGWDKKTPLMDPFCGSGTLLVEAALYATGIPSMIERQHYAFKNFKGYDEATWNELYDAAVQHSKTVRALPVEIVGSDIQADMVLKARRNLRRVSIGRFVEVRTASFEEVKSPGWEKGLMITNPPYGERLGADVTELYESIGNWMKSELKGFQCWIISSSNEGLKSVGLKAEQKMRLFNGSLECSFRRYSIYEGSKKGTPRE